MVTVKFLRHWLVVLGLGLALAGCAKVSAIEGNRETAPEAAVERIFVASVRASRFAQERATTTFAPFSYSAYDIAIPPGRPRGTLPKYTRGTGLDPQLNFVAAARHDFASVGPFRQAMSGGAAPFVLVHGFNTTFEQSVTTQAQIAYDLQLTSPQLVFAWPSNNSLLTYREDQERAAAAVDDLVSLLRQLRGVGQGRLVLAGYSMGSSIVMAALREFRHDPAFVARIEVVLFGPDMDADVFAAVIRELPPLAVPVTVLGNRHDKALRLARWTFDGTGHQLGAAGDASELPDVPLVFVDMGSVRHRGSGHFALVSYPPLIDRFAAMAAPDIADFAASLVGVPGATVTRNGQATYIQLPDLAAAQNE